MSRAGCGSCSVSRAVCGACSVSSAGCGSCSVSRAVCGVLSVSSAVTEARHLTLVGDCATEELPRRTCVHTSTDAAPSGAHSH